MSAFGTSPSALAAVTTGRTLPWVRCTATGDDRDPSKAWAIPDGMGGTRPPLWREFVILDHRNEYLMSFNFTASPIDGASNAAQRALVRDALRAAAALPDTDGDHLPDAWELDEFGVLDAVNADTDTASGLPALLAYGLGQSPHAFRENRGLHLTAGDGGFLLSYTRRRDRRPSLQWSFERSAALAEWNLWPEVPAGVATTLYDGTGTERVIHLFPGNGPSLDVIRLKVTVGPDPGP